MRKLFSAVVVLAVLVIPSQAEAQAIIVRIPDTLLPGIGAGGEVDVGLSGPARCQDVQNANHFIFQCQGEVTNLTGRGVTLTKENTNEDCNAAFGQGFELADSFHYHVSATGHASLSCKFRK